ncbi:MAG: hypothetical protein O7G83_07165, partial [Proteobacteria bacterium]|nr:hypothetical protein [Pseudomonadota bacterium]
RSEAVPVVAVGLWWLVAMPWESENGCTTDCGQLRDIANKNSSEIDVNVIFLPVKRRDALNKTMVHLNRSPKAVRLHGCTRSSNAGAVTEQVHSMSDSLLEYRSGILEVWK